MAPGPFGVAQPRVRHPMSALATHGLPRAGYPTFYRYYADTKTAFAHPGGSFLLASAVAVFALLSSRARVKAALEPGPW